MADDISDDNLKIDHDWFVASRWQALDAEYRANYLRIVSVVAFYCVHLLQHYRPFQIFQSEIVSDRVFHLAVTLVVASWLLASLAVEFSLRQRIFPKQMAYYTTGLDLVLLSALLCLGDGQRSPLVMSYALVLVLAAMRFDLRLIRFATCGAIASYLFLLAMGRWPTSISTLAVPTVPRYAQCMTLLTIAITGIMLGQMIRRVRVISEYLAQRVQNPASQAITETFDPDQKGDTDGR